MGSFIAAMAAAGWRPQEIRDRCHEELVRRSPFNDYTLPRVALIRSRKAGRMLERLFGELAIEELAKPLFTVSADLLSSRLVVHRRGSLVEAVGASMSIPGLVPPLPRGGRLLVDGGVLNNLPVDAMAETDEGPIVAVDVVRRLEPVDVDGEQPLPSIMETLSRATVLGSVERAEANRALALVVVSPSLYRTCPSGISARSTARSRRADCHTGGARRRRAREDPRCRRRPLVSRPNFRQPSGRARSRKPRKGAHSMSTQYDIWAYRVETVEPGLGADVVGYNVEALDGGIGKVDEATDEVGASSIVVDTGPWIFGKKVVLPAGTIDRIDPDEAGVYLHQPKEQINQAPPLAQGRQIDQRPPSRVAGCQLPGGPGCRAGDRRA